MLDRDNAALLIVDVQGKLAQLMHQRESLYSSLQKLIRGCQALELPILWAEQVPQKLGPTVPEVAELMGERRPVAKNTFSCCGNPDLMGQIEGLGRKQVLLAGIESHICVYQTAVDLLHRGFEVQVVTDAVSSRTASNRELGLKRMCLAGAFPTSVEMALLELLKVAEGEGFRQVSKIIR